MRWLAALLLLAGPVDALSCKRPNPAEDFNRFAAAEETYSIVVGTLEITGEIPEYREGEPRSVAAVARIRDLGRTGLGEAREQAVELRSTCLAAWCGGFPQDRSEVYILVLRHDGPARVLDLSPCPGGVIQRRSDAVLDLYQTCLRRGRCTEAEVQSFEIY